VNASDGEPAGRADDELGPKVSFGTEDQKFDTTAVKTLLIDVGSEAS
jgi:hypothetical protein